MPSGRSLLYCKPVLHSAPAAHTLIVQQQHIGQEAVEHKPGDPGFKTFYCNLWLAPNESFLGSSNTKLAPGDPR